MKRAYAVSLVTQGAWRFYTLTIPSDVLAKCCYVSARYEDAADGFQRRLDKKRAEAIAQYIDKDLGTIPNSVILSAQPAAKLSVTGRGKTIQFIESEKAFLVLDGQHRVYGYRLAKTSLRVPAVVYNGLTKSQEVKLFVDINTKQRPVPNELLLDISHMAGDESAEQNVLREVFDIVNNDRSGAMFQMLSPHERAIGKISRVTFNAAIKPHLSNFKDSDPIRVAELVGNYLTAIHRQLMSKDIEQVISNPTVFRGLFELFPHVARRVSSSYSDDLSSDKFFVETTPLFGGMRKNLFTSPGDSYKELGKKLISRFEKTQQF